MKRHKKGMMEMNQKKNNRFEYMIITICGVFIITYAMMVDKIMNFPEVMSSTPLKILLTVFSCIVFIITVCLTVRLFILIHKDYVERR